MNLIWIKCERNAWCSFEGVNTEAINTDGVYIIWHGGDNSRVVYVGQGVVADRIVAHRQNSDILYYRKFGGLFVTWAAVALADQDGVERYLADSWNPLVGGAYPVATPIAVNSPW